MTGNVALSDATRTQLFSGWIEFGARRVEHFQRIIAASETQMVAVVRNPTTIWFHSHQAAWRNTCRREMGCTSGIPLYSRISGALTHPRKPVCAATACRAG